MSSVSRNDMFTRDPVNSTIVDMNPKIYLAPMSGVTDLPFRIISRKFGAGHCFFEMLDSNAIVYKHPETGRILKTLKNDRPIAAQRKILQGTRSG